MQTQHLGLILFSLSWIGVSCASPQVESTNVYPSLPQALKSEPAPSAPGDEPIQTLFGGRVLLVNTSRGTLVVPAVGRCVGGRCTWSYLKTTESGTYGEGWVGGVTHQQHIYGVLDHMSGDMGHVLRVVRSSASETQWRELAVVKKPHYMAEYKALTVAPNGLALDIHLKDCAGCGIALGVYRYWSQDGGRSWRQVKKP